MERNWVTAILVTSFMLACVTHQVLSAEPDAAPKITNETQALEFLKEYDNLAAVAMNEVTKAEWDFDTNITDDKQNIMLEQQLEYANFSQEQEEKSFMYDVTNMSPDVQRQFTKIRDIGTSAQTNATKLARLNKVISSMESIYGKAKVCVGKQGCQTLEPVLEEILSTSRDYDLLTKVWQGWRDQTGPKMRSMFEEYVTLSNEAVQILGYKDQGDHWRSWYDTKTFEEDVAALFDQVSPLYKQLHAYVRRKLREVYGADKFPKSGHIPAHLLGNMWSQEWTNIYDLVIPFKNKASLDVTKEMLSQNYTPKKMFETAESFFKSLGLEAMVDKFWNKSMIVKPPDGRDVVCHASAWDFYTKDDFRIKMCTNVNQEDLTTIHHEMGHVQYFMQYKDQPVVYRDGANPGFHEAIGDTMALSVNTPEHMTAIGLLKTYDKDDEADINFLLKTALEKVAFLPFGYLIDQWRWSVFRGDTPPAKYNKGWWDLRCRLQGVSAPVKRLDDDFDPGAKYHVAADVPYIRYFVSFIIQFQFHKSLCDAAGYQGPLHHCDIYNNKDAGAKLMNMLKLGSSKPWPEAMQELTGQKKMNASAILDYFEPLMKFLEEQNGEDVGWDDGCSAIPESGGGGAERSAISHVTVLFLSLVVMIMNAK